MASPPPTLPKGPEEIALDADEQPEETEVRAEGMEDEQCDAHGETGLATPPLDMDVEGITSVFSSLFCCITDACR